MYSRIIKPLSLFFPCFLRTSYRLNFDNRFQTNFKPFTTEIEPDYIGDSTARQKMLLKSSQKSEFWKSSSEEENDEDVSIQESNYEELAQHVRNQIKPKRGIDLYAESKLIERAKIDKRLAWEARKRQQVHRFFSLERNSILTCDKIKVVFK